ncbi:hypothetical protein FRC17_009447 [Serendipita sp. 399]|nr:hypothetical protein FRC17_009447 [Serendipita sp. 399]
MSSSKKSRKLARELDDYNSLIRSLHIISTQNIVPHLTGSLAIGQRASRGETPPPESTSSAESESAEQVAQGSLKGKGRSRSSNRKRQAVGNGSGGHGPKLPIAKEEVSRKNIWTAWPLLRGTLSVPEWSLQDEVRLLAEKAHKTWFLKYHALQNPAVQGDHPGAGQMDNSVTVDNDHTGDIAAQEDVDGAFHDSLDELLSKYIINGLNLEASAFLSHIFALLAAHRPDVAPSLQGRLEPMDWRSILRVVSTSGWLNDEILRRTHETMSAVYGSKELKGKDISLSPRISTETHKRFIGTINVNAPNESDESATNETAHLAEKARCWSETPVAFTGWTLVQRHCHFGNCGIEYGSRMQTMVTRFVSSMMCPKRVLLVNEEGRIQPIKRDDGKTFLESVKTMLVQ